MNNASRLIVFVAGTPVPQGSMVAMISKTTNKPFMKQASSALPKWRNRVVTAVREEMEILEKHQVPWTPEDKAYQLDVDFYIARPKSATKKELADPWRWKRPDIDKLVRAILDALETAGAVGDDARIAKLVAEKRYAEEHQNTGVAILLRPLGTNQLEE